MRPGHLALTVGVFLLRDLTLELLINLRQLYRNGILVLMIDTFEYDSIVVYIIR